MRLSIVLLSLIGAVCGCSGDADSTDPREPAPRPVSVITLENTDPTRSLTVTGTVGSWKTEDIGFEVSGRLQFVIEPETNVSGPDGDDEPRPLASIDPERYATAVESAKAKIVMLERQMAAAIIQRDQVLPAQRDAAVATQELAQGDFDLVKSLFEQKAVAKAELDKFDANLKTAKAQVVQLDATRESQSAEIASFDAQIDQAAAALKDAQRDQKDCTLVAPFRGQIAKVHVIPGGTVQRGEPVVTLQMMDPMKIEFEVSGERARQLHYKDGLELFLPLPDGTAAKEEGVIYRTDAVADPSTRTFTITVLIRNRLVPVSVPDDVDVATLTKTRDIWSLIRGILDDSDDAFVEENAIHKDDDGEFVWKVIEDGSGPGRTRGPLLRVEKVRVTSGEKTPNFLGLWTFRDVTVDDPGTLVADHDRILGRLVLPEGETEFSGDTVLFEREQWLLRPGDLVGVDLSEEPMPS
jgi:multidrug efflux pump subunit AcrA (membrane-fusion protein)